MEALADPSRPARAITWRSVSLGLFGGCLVCAAVPYNDFVLNNTYLVGNSLPVIVVMLAFLVALLVNAPLHRWAPRHALQSGELTCALLMMLVACAVPTSGLLRYLPPALVVPFFRAQSDPQYQQILEAADLPAWMFPRFSSPSPQQWGNDSVVTGYALRWTGRGMAPYLAWLRPMLSWGIFTAALWGAILSLMSILRRQWAETEKLAFPLAQVHLALIEQPSAGQALNGVLRRRGFWIAFSAVFLLHLWNGCAAYSPQHFTPIPLGFGLRSIFSESPLHYIEDNAVSATVFFTVASMTFFINSSLAFTMWFLFILLQGVRMILGGVRGESIVPGATYQHFGAVVAYACAILWIGRHHWAMVVRQAFRGPRENEPRGRYLSYPLLFWTLVVSLLVLTGWLHAAGMTLGGAAVIVLVLLTIYLVVARIVAETGLVFVGVQFPIFIPFYIAGSSGLKWMFPMRDFVLGTFANSLHDLRENLAVYSSHGMVVADATTFKARSSDTDSAPERRRGRSLALIVVLMLAIAYPLGWLAHLRTEYTYASTIDQEQRSPINDWAADGVIGAYMEGASIGYQNMPQPTPFSRAWHTTGGFVATIALTIMRLRFAWWPIHPAGFVLVYTWPVSQMWFSIFLGWLLKVIVLRFGGSSLYTHTKPVMLGLVVGECVAIGFWMLVAIVLSSLGIDYQTIRVLPI